MLLAFSTASSGVRNVSTESTGPKISSCAMRWLWATFVNRVGRKKKPRSGRSQARLVEVGALGDAGRDELRDLRELGRELIAPTSVFLSSGSPTRMRRRGGP